MKQTITRNFSDKNMNLSEKISQRSPVLFAVLFFRQLKFFVLRIDLRVIGILTCPGLCRRFWLLWLVKCVWFDKMCGRAKLWISLTAWTALVKAVNWWKPFQTLPPIWRRVFVRGLIRAISYTKVWPLTQFFMFNFSSLKESMVALLGEDFPFSMF